MTSILIKKEDYRIYWWENPFPKKIDYHPSDYEAWSIDCVSWFLSCEQLGNYARVHPDHEERFLKWIYVNVILPTNPDGLWPEEVAKGIEIPAERYEAILFNPMRVIRKDRTSYKPDPYYLAYFVEPEQPQENEQVKLWNELYCDIYGGFDGEWNEEYLNKLMAKFILNRK